MTSQRSPKKGTPLGDALLESKSPKRSDTVGISFTFESGSKTTAPTSTSTVERQLEFIQNKLKILNENLYKLEQSISHEDKHDNAIKKFLPSGTAAAEFIGVLDNYKRVKPSYESFIADQDEKHQLKLQSFMDTIEKILAELNSLVLSRETKIKGYETKKIPTPEPDASKDNRANYSSVIPMLYHIIADCYKNTRITPPKIERKPSSEGFAPTRFTGKS